MTEQQKPLANLKVLVADQDARIGALTRGVLRSLGFEDVTHVESGRQALEVMGQKEIDILITEWQMAELSGIELLAQLRRGPRTPNPLMPVIMMTARAEKQDVQVARDSGVNEFLIKPYTASIIFNRLQRLIDHPQDFVVAPTFAGPDRRRLTKILGSKDRRSHLPTVKNRRDMRQAHSGSPPIIIPADFHLKDKIGIKTPLSTIITPEVLARTQDSIEEKKAEYVDWLQEDFKKLEEGYLAMQRLGRNEFAMQAFMDATLLIKSRAGIFGYTVASQIAQQMYSFCRNGQVPEKTHDLIVLKHFQSLKAVLGSNIRHEPGELGQVILGELRVMMQKFQPAA